MVARYGTAALCGAAIAACSLVTDLGGLAGEVAPRNPEGGSEAAVDGVAVLDAGAEAAPPSAYALAVLADGPVSYLRLEETTGTIAADATGNGNSATLVGSATWGAAGIAGKGLEIMNGLLDYGAKFDFSGRRDFSLEAWILTSKIDGLYRHVFHKDDPDAAGGRTNVGLYIHDEKIGFERYVGGEPSIAFDGFLPHLSKWTHVVASYNGEFIYLHVDGELIGTDDDRRPQPAMPASRFYAGAHDQVSGVLVGTIDEIAIYDKALTPQQILTHYRAAGR